jgi:WD40 repeat protein
MYRNSLVSHSLALAAQSASALEDGDRELATIAAYQALRISYTPQAERALAHATGGTLTQQLGGSGSTEGQYAIESATFSPSGERLATTATMDFTVRIWDSRSAKALATLSGHTARVHTAAFDQDGHRVITVSNDGTARIWDVRSGKELLTLGDQANPIRAAAFSPDGERFLTTSADSTARIWEIHTGKELLTLGGRSGAVETAAFSPDGDRVLTTTADHKVRIWEAGSGRELLTLGGGENGVMTAAFSPTGERVLTMGYDHTASIWGARSGKEQTTLGGSANQIYAAAFSPDGERVLTTGEEDTVSIWDVRSGRELVAFSDPADPVQAAAFSADGERVITRGASMVYVWDAEHGQKLACPVDASMSSLRPTMAVMSVDRIVVGYSERRIGIWQIWPKVPELRKLAGKTCGSCEPRTEAERRALRLYPLRQVYRQYPAEFYFLFLATVYLLCGLVLGRAVLAPRPQLPPTARTGNDPRSYFARGAYGNGISFLILIGLLMVDEVAFSREEKFLLLFALLPSGAWTGIVFAHHTRWEEGRYPQYQRILFGALTSILTPLGMIVVALTIGVSAHVYKVRVGDRVEFAMWVLFLAGVRYALNVLGGVVYIYLIQPRAARYRALHEDDD